jgi:outer membrane lipoprotein LolB
LLLTLVLVGGCASVTPRPSGDWLDERRNWFAQYPDWSVEGRLGLSDGERGGTLAMHWQARGAIHDIRLRTLAGGRQWRLVMEPGRAVLTGSEVGRIEGPDPDGLVEQAIGWPIPVRHMADWLRGLPGPDAARVRYADDGLMQGLAWGDWSLEYLRWAGWGDGAVHLPARIDAVRTPHEVRLVLRGWRFDAAAGGISQP